MNTIKIIIVMQKFTNQYDKRIFHKFALYIILCKLIIAHKLNEIKYVPTHQIISGSFVTFHTLKLTCILVYCVNNNW